MKLKRTRATYVACVLCAVFTPVMLAPVDEPKQPDPSLPQATFSSSTNMTSSALANPSASLAPIQSFQNNTDNQQPPGNSAPPVIGASSANNSPTEKTLSTVAVKKDPLKVDVTVAQEKDDKSVPPGPQAQLPDPEAGSKKDNADQGQGPPLPSPSPREGEPEIMAEKKEVVETAPPSVSNSQVPVSGNTVAQGGEGKEANPPQMPSESAMMVGAKPEETKAPQVTNPDINQEAKNVNNESQVSPAGEQAQEPQQSADLAKESQPSADLAKESQPSAVPSEIAQSEPVEPLSLSEQSASETQEVKPVIEETHKPEGSEIEAQPPKEPEQQAENTQGSDTVLEQPKEPEQNANETQEEPEQPAVEEEAKGTDTQDNPVEENVEEIRDQYENELSGIEKTANDYSYTLDSSQQSSMATDMQANNPSFNDPLGKDTLDNREVTIDNGGEFADDEDSHFFAYFLTIMVSAIIFYLVFHNKQRIIALIIEGRSPGERRGRRTSSRGKYHKLDNNLEEAITATKGAKRH
nr:proteoglycan 4-like isoform X3 [Penaeus vannamei]